MKRTIALLFALVSLLSACAPAPQQGTAPTESPTIPTEQGSPSSLTADDFIRYFNEVCLDAEFTNQGDVTLLQLLYHPSLTCGMDAAQCEAAIRQLWQTKNS